MQLWWYSNLQCCNLIFHVLHFHVIKMKNISDRTRSQAQPNKEVAMQSIQQNYLDSPYQLKNISRLLSAENICVCVATLMSTLWSVGGMNNQIIVRLIREIITSRRNFHSSPNQSHSQTFFRIKSWQLTDIKIDLILWA